MKDHKVPHDTHNEINTSGVDNSVKRTKYMHRTFFFFKKGAEWKSLCSCKQNSGGEIINSRLWLTGKMAEKRTGFISLSISDEVGPTKEQD